MTVVGNVWMQIPIPQPYVSFETKKAEAEKKLQSYRDWYLEQPVTHESVLFDGDETTRARLTQALIVHSANGYLPPAWITYDNNVFPLPNVDALKALVNTVSVAFSNRFFEMSTLRGQIMAATDETQLDAVVIPVAPRDGMVA